MYWVEYKRLRQRKWLCVGLADNLAMAEEMAAQLAAHGLQVRIVEVTEV